MFGNEERKSFAIFSTVPDLQDYESAFSESSLPIRQ